VWAIGDFADDGPDKADALFPAFSRHRGGDRAGMLVGDTEPAVPAAEPFLRLLVSGARVCTRSGAALAFASRCRVLRAGKR